MLNKYVVEVDNAFKHGNLGQESGAGLKKLIKGSFKAEDLLDEAKVKAILAANTDVQTAKTMMGSPKYTGGWLSKDAKAFLETLIKEDLITKINAARYINQYLDQYEKVLGLDTRVADPVNQTKEGEVDKGIIGKIKDFVGGITGWGKKETEQAAPKAEEKAATGDSVFSWNYWKNKVVGGDQKANTQAPTQATETEEKVKAPEVKTETDQQPKSSAVSTNVEEVNSKNVLDNLHANFQKFTEHMISTAKAECYSTVIEFQKQASSCQIRQPKMSIKELEAKPCDKLSQQAETALKNCDYAFPMKTEHDGLIQKFMEQSVTISAQVTEDSLRLTAHNDESLVDMVYKASFSNAAPRLLDTAYQAETVYRIGYAGETNGGSMLADEAYNQKHEL